MTDQVTHLLDQQNNEKEHWAKRACDVAKKSLFHSIFEIRRAGTPSLWFALTCIVLEFLQLLTFSFSKEFELGWHRRISQTLQSIVYLSRIDRWFTTANSGSESTPIFALIACVIVLLLPAAVLISGYLDLDKPYQQQVSGKFVVLRHACSLFTRVLYIPLLALLFSPLRCDSAEDVDCTSGARLGIAAFAFICSVTAFLFAALICTIQIEHKDSVLAQAPGNTPAYVMLTKTVLVSLFVCVTSQSSQAVTMLGVFCTLGGAVLMHAYWQLPYLSMQVNSVSFSLAGVFTWTAAVMTYTTIFSDQTQSGSIVLAYGGSPAVFGMCALALAHRYSWLSQVDVQDCRTAAILNRKLINSIETQVHSRKSVQSPGLKESHSSSYSIEDEGKHDAEFSAKETSKVMETWFTYASKRYPSSAAICLSQAKFYIMLQDNMFQCHRHLMLATELEPSLAEQYIIFENRKTNDIELQNCPKSRQVLQYMQFTEHAQRAERGLNEGLSLQYSFWTELLQSKPDPEKLASLSTRIKVLVAEAHQEFRKAMQISRGNTTVIRNYAKFMLALLNDDATAELLDARALELEQASVETGFESTDLRLFDARTAIIAVSAERDTLGTITNANLAACELCGRGEVELIGASLDILIPAPYQEPHGGWLRKYEQTGGSGFFDNSQQLFLQSKTGFIRPVSISVTRMNGGMSRTTLLAVIRELPLDENEYLALVNAGTGAVYSCSAGFAAFFSVSTAQLNTEQCMIQQLVPGMQPLYNKAAQADLHRPTQTECTVHRGHFEYQCTVKAQDIHHGGLSVQAVLLHMGGPVAEATEAPTTFKTDSPPRKLAKSPKNKPRKAHHVDSELELYSHLDDPSVSRMSTNSQQFPGSAPLQLCESSRVEEEEFDDGSDEGNANQNNTVRFSVADGDDRFNKADRQRAMAQKANSIASSNTSVNQWRRALRNMRQAMLSQNTRLEGSMRWLLIAIFSTILVVLVLSTVQYSVGKEVLQDYDNRILVASTSGHRESMAIQIAYYTRTLELVRAGVLNTTEEAHARAKLFALRQEFQAFQENLYFTREGLSDEHHDLYVRPQVSIRELLGDPTAGGRVLNGKDNLLSLVSKYTITAHVLASTPLSEIESKHYGVYYIRNNLEAITGATNTSSNLIEEAVNHKYSEVLAAETAMLVVSLAALTFMVLFVFRPAISGVLHTRYQVFDLIFGVPSESIKELQKQAYERMNDDAQATARIDNDGVPEHTNARVIKTEEETIVIRKRDRKQDSTAYVTPKSEWLKLSTKIGTLFIVASFYFLFTYIREIQFTSTVSSSIATLNFMNRLASQPWFTLYYTREGLVHPSMKGDFGIPSLPTTIQKTRQHADYTFAILNGVIYGNDDYGLDGAVHEAGSSDTYFQSVCPLLSFADCTTFHHGVLVNGIYATVDEFLSLSDSYTLKAEIAGANASTATVKSALQEQAFLDMIALNDPGHIEQVIQTLPAKHATKQLTRLNDFKSSRETIVIVANVILLILFVFVYRPFVRSLDQQLKSTRSILFMLPYDVMQKSPAIRQFIRDTYVK